jgi:hypothetical protein
VLVTVLYKDIYVIIIILSWRDVRKTKGGGEELKRN